MVLPSSMVLPASTRQAAPPSQRPHPLKHAPLLAHYLQEREAVQSSPVTSLLLLIPLLIIISGGVRLHARLPLKSETAMKEGAAACVAALWRQHLALISMDSVPDCQGLKRYTNFHPQSIQNRHGSSTYLHPAVQCASPSFSGAYLPRTYSKSLMEGQKPH